MFFYSQVNAFNIYTLSEQDAMHKTQREFFVQAPSKNF